MMVKINCLKNPLNSQFFLMHRINEKCKNELILFVKFKAFEFLRQTIITVWNLYFLEKKLICTLLIF